MIIARTSFCLSIAATLFWAFGFAAERIAGTEPLLWSYAVSAFFVTALSAIVVFRAWPQFLTIAPDTTARFLRAIAVWTLLAYIMGMLVVGGLAYLLLNPSGQPSDALRSEASLTAYILALWFPLWFAPAVGLSLGWWKTETPICSNGPIERDARVSGARPSL